MIIWKSILMNPSKVNYEWTVQDKLHTEQMKLVDHLVHERRPKVDIEVKRLKDMDKRTFDETMEEFFDS